VDERDEVVLVLKVLAADTNRGYQDISTWVVESVDGRKVTSLRQLVGLLEAGNGAPFAVLKSPRGHEIVLDRQRARESRDEILATYRVPSDRSPDLAASE
jgi:hypothetical protein